MRKHRAFAERTGDDEPVASGIHLQAEATLHLGVVEAIILGELGRNGGDNSGPHVDSPSDISSIYQMPIPAVNTIQAMICEKYIRSKP
jgi:hypothetical protein